LGVGAERAPFVHEGVHLLSDIAADITPSSPARSPLFPERRHERFNRRLDGLDVPAMVNEALIADLRAQLARFGDPRHDGYWLLTARLAEMALLCAGRYADEGDIRAAGDLLFNPRRIWVYLRGAPQPVLKDRHRRLSEQFNPDDLPLAEFAVWFRRNAITHVAEPALLPALGEQRDRCGRIREAYREAFKARMCRVVDAMRFDCLPAAGCAAAAPGADRRRASGRCSFKPADYGRLGRHVARTCRDPAFRSPYLVHSAGRCLRRNAALAVDDRGRGTPLVPAARI
jgi:hypothetical protein